MNQNHICDRLKDSKGKDMSRYYDKYIALASLIDDRIVAYGNDPVKVFKKAKRIGHNEPSISYYHRPDSEQIYIAA